VQNEREWLVVVVVASEFMLGVQLHVQHINHAWHLWYGLAREMRCALCNNKTCLQKSSCNVMRSRRWAAVKNGTCASDGIQDSATTTHQGTLRRVTTESTWSLLPVGLL
jgi:hypothetical protein